LRGLNTFRKRPSYRRSLRELFAVLVVLCLSVACSADGTPKPLSQYLHEEWGSERGFPGGSINVIAQTPDGYLWIGTQKGLVRFDGSNFRLFSQISTNSSSITSVLGLLADAQGSLWVRQPGSTLLRYRNGKFEDFSNSFEIPEIAITRMSPSKDGKAVFATVLNGIVTYENGGFKTLARSPELPNFIVTSMAPDPDGAYWVGTRDLGLFQIRDGKISARPDVLPKRQINVLLSARAKQLWIGTDKGLFLWNDNELAHIGQNSLLSERQILSLSEDSDNNIWVGTDHGMYRLDAESSFMPKTENTLGNGPVPAILGDREGNIWAATPKGLERLRNTIFTTYGAAEGLSEETNGPVHADSDGRTWFAPIRGGLYWLNGTKIGTVREAGLDKDVVYSIAGGNGNLWIGRQHGGLSHLENVAGKWHAVTYTDADGLGQNSVYTVRVTRNGAVWAGTLSAGLTRIGGGKFERFTTANGLISNTISSILESRNGTIWVATPRGLSAFLSNHWVSYSNKDGLPSDDVNCLFEDSEGTLWIGTMSGLAALRSGQILIPAQGPEFLRGPIFGIEEDTNGFLWTSASDHIAMINRKKLLGPDFSDVDIREFGLADGLRNTDGVKRDEAVASDRSGNIWFSLNRGLSVVDTNRLRRASAPSILQLEALFVNGNPTSLSSPVRISPNPQKITFNYAGISLSVPDRVRFKYKLDGFDHAWSDPLIDREASYTNLNPGSYVFHVIASNSDGLWNGSELTIPFTIERAFWQTGWFRTSCVLSILLLVWLAHRYRLYRLTQQLNMRMEERLDERTRIAQDLHDTLLQGLLSASMQLNIADEKLPDDSPAKPLVGRVLELMNSVSNEGRTVVQGLRSSNALGDDLELAFLRIRHELPVSEHVNFRIVVEGKPRRLHATIRDEVYRIGREALVNAFRHSTANLIEVKVGYEPSRLRLIFRDNGRGIDPGMVRAGRDGHWGLSGMRERAERIGARLKVSSRAAAGTEVELLIPEHIAFRSPTARRLKWIPRFGHIRPASERPKSGSEMRDHGKDAASNNQ
jgi:ligand-binding sensor domain-containing protein/signal transduction histidine kinase